MSSKPVVFVTRRLPKDVEARLTRDYQPRLNEDDRFTTTDELLAGCEGADALLPCPTDRLSPEVLSRLPKSVRIIATFSVGYDHINVPAAKERGIVVTNTPDVLTDATADIAMLLMLGAARRASEGEKLIRTNTWLGWGPTHMMGTQVSGKRLGIVGLGRIGQAVAQRARGFNMEIHYQDFQRMPADREKGAVFHATVEELLPLCDFLTLHCPSTPETRGLLNAERLKLLPRHAIVVNTARGDVVVDEALIDALKTNRIAGAGIDVFVGEPKINPGYAALPNTFLLPHLGSATVETRNAMGFRALDNLDAYFAGQPPRDRVG